MQTCCNGQTSLRWSGNLQECSLYYTGLKFTKGQISLLPMQQGRLGMWKCSDKVTMWHLNPQWFGQAVVWQAGSVQVLEKQELQWDSWTFSSIIWVIDIVILLGKWFHLFHVLSYCWPQQTRLWFPTKRWVLFKFFKQDLFCSMTTFTTNWDWIPPQLADGSLPKVNSA